MDNNLNLSLKKKSHTIIMDNDIYNYNGKSYKTAAAAKRARTINNKRLKKEEKQEQTLINKELVINHGLPVYIEDENKPMKINKSIRLDKFNNYNKANVKEETKNNIYIEKNKRNITEIKEFLNGSFKEITIENKQFNENLTEDEAFKTFNTKYNADVTEYIQNVIFLQNIKNLIYYQLINEFTNAQTDKYKLIATVIIKYTKIKIINEDGDIEYSTKYFNNPNTIILRSKPNINEYCNDVKDNFFNSLVNHNKESNSIFFKIVNIKIQIAKRKLTKAGSYIKLNDEIEAKKATVNIKNNDNYCLIYCLLAHKYYDKLTTKDNKNKVYHYKKYFNEIIQPKDIKYPIDIQHDIPKFEKLNNIKINVFEYDKKHEKLQTVYNTNIKNSNVVNLLLVYELNKDNTKNEHLIWIKNFNRLMSNGSDKRHYFCTQCLNSHYLTEAKLIEHQKLCLNNESVAIKMPEQDKAFIKFKNEGNQFMHPFNCFMDFESTLKNINKNIGENSLRYQEHEANSCGIKFNCIHDEYSKPIKIINNSDSEKVLKSMMETVEEYAKVSYKLIKQNVLYKPLTEEQKNKHFKKKYCEECNIKFDEKIKKVYHHDHISGEYISSLCNKCNGKFQYKRFLPIYVHNLKGYDGHFIIKAMTNYGYQCNDNDLITCIPNNEEKYISFSKKIKVGEYKDKKGIIQNLLFEIRFIDSFAFMASSLGNLSDNLHPKSKQIINLNETFNKIDNPSEEAIKIHLEIINKIHQENINELRDIYKNTSDEFKNDDEFKLMITKGVYPYDFINDYSRMYTTILPAKDRFYNKLNDSNINDKEYEISKNVWNVFKCNKFLDYHNIYLKSDVLLLSDIWSNFRKTCFKIYSLDCSYYYTAPGLSWDAFLKHKNNEDKNFKIELLTDHDKYLFFESGIRGGLSQISKRHATANNKYMSNYNEKLEDEYILYLDANNLYGYSMCQYLPKGDFKWSTNEKFLINKNIEFKDHENLKSYILNIEDNANIGYTFDINLTYNQVDKYGNYSKKLTEQIHDLHNNYALACENKSIKKEMLNEWQQEDYKESNISKLITNFNDKINYVVNYRILKLFLELGLRITKVNRVLQYEQQDYMKSYIMKNTNERIKSKNDFEKDFYKLMNNSVYGKTMENIRHRINFKLVNSEKKAIAMKNDYKKFTVFSPNLIGVHLCKREVTLNKPIFIGQTVLDDSKFLMVDFHYNFMLKKIKRENIDLLFTDTDSLCYHIKKENPYEIIKDNKSYFDLSDYPENHELYDSTNKKVIGKFKNESIKQISEFVALRSKLYCYTTDDEHEHKRCKGIKKSVCDMKLNLNLYKDILFNRSTYNTSQNVIISDDHNIYSQTINKIALSARDDKIFIKNNNIDTYCIGHYKTLKK